MLMPGIRNKIAVGPVAQVASPRRLQLIKTLDAAPDDKIVLISLGGMGLPIDTRRWPQNFQKLRVIVPDDFNAADSPNIYKLADLNTPFSELFASSDLIVTKPGYGSFVEAACLNKQLLYVPRQDWPEMAILTNWAQKRISCEPIEPHELVDGSFIARCQLPAPQRQFQTTTPDGNREAAHIIVNQLCTTHQN